MIFQNRTNLLLQVLEQITQKVKKRSLVKAIPHAHFEVGKSEGQTKKKLWITSAQMKRDLVLQTAKVYLYKLYEWERKGNLSLLSYLSVGICFYKEFITLLRSVIGLVVRSLAGTVRGPSLCRTSQYSWDLTFLKLSRWAFGWVSWHSRIIQLLVQCNLLD